MLFWDILINLHSDYIILFKKGRIRLPTIVYFLSRFSLCLFPLLSIVATPGIDCHLWTTIVESFFAISNILISLMFFLRVRAIYLQNRIIILTFFFLWVGTTICALLNPIFGFITEARVPGSLNICAFWEIRLDLILALAVSLVNDTAVFFAIAYRLYKISLYEFNVSENGSTNIGFSKKRVWRFMQGKNLSAFVKAVLQDGQLFYLASFLMSITMVVLLFIPSVDLTIRVSFAIPYVAVMNCIACHVFRHVRLGNIPEESLSSVRILSGMTELEFRSSLPTSPRLV
ncbi:hypothetical protein K435DRAFT_656640 [Dendrothele bispora CBS 962.96]|uniref:G-protein coupled receptors family 1 profile domain-containing protein n=1 Tax=Dendrothele bispora (strain CBS 962.96) TaxID=1314807 RepID=A0A4S8MF97_DENBC|nr:hypothetical protein K435DRAFT_656640 [Dendrothele bispora CBS 962.96]